METKVFIIISVLIVLIWIGFIFTFSAQPGPDSDSISYMVLDSLVDTLDRAGIDILANISRTNLHIFIRKTAHFFYISF